MESQNSNNEEEQLRLDYFDNLSLNNVFWSELVNIREKLSFSPYGSATIEVPKFHRENIKKIIDSISSKDLQYSTNPELKAAIIKYFPTKDIINRNITKEEIAISPGAVLAIHVILSLFTTNLEKDEILLLNPFYGFHFTELFLLSGFKNFIGVNRKLINERFSIDFDDLEKKLNENTKFIILVQPDNPMTSISSKQEYEKLSSILEKFPRVLILEDMSYFAYLRTGKELISFSSIGNNSERTFSVFSGGKLFNTTSTRCGWTIGPKNLMPKVIEAMYFRFLLTSSLESVSIAENLKSALEPFEGCDSYYSWIKKDQNERFNKIIEIFKDFNVQIIEPEGTYYLLINVENYRGKIPKNFFYSLDDKNLLLDNLDMAFCRIFLLKGIGFLPLSSLTYLNKFDCLVRISCNRSYEDIEFLASALKETKLTYSFL